MSLMRTEESKTKLKGPFRELEDMVNQMFADFFGDGERAKLYKTRPAFNMYREGDNLVIDVAIPGFSKDEITVKLEEDNILNIRGEHREEEEKKEENRDYLYREFSRRSFVRSIRLPSGIDPASLKAKCQDGVLKLTVQLPKESQKAQEITVE